LAFEIIIIVKSICFLIRREAIIVMAFFQNIINWIEKNKQQNYDTEPKKWHRWWMPLVAFFAFLWFMIRVLPKPSRIRYPCQRAAAPLAMGFVAWFIGFVSMTFSIKGIIRKIKSGSYLSVILLLAILILATGFYVSTNNFKPAVANNEYPIGKAKGINAGRVVWNYEPNATSWDGESNYWWDSENTDYNIVQEMFNSSINKLASANNVKKAWEKVFRYFNSEYRNENRNYQQGELIAVKLNLNTHSSYAEKSNEINISPQVVLSLVESLVKNTQVKPANIILYDASRPLGDYLYEMINEKYPEVRFVDNDGGKGRQKVKLDQDSAIYYQGIDYDKIDHLPQVVTNADYLINIANLKKHSLAGVTLTAKNHFGSIYSGNYNNWTPMHLHDGVSASSRKKELGNPLVNLIGHQDLGQKTLLYLIDGLYGGMNQQSVNPHKWGMAPFNNGWSSSLFVSQDPIAIDSVALDILKTETDLLTYSDNYLHEAALANNPPSGVDYDPENDGSNLDSLGVHEHWNNPEDKKYSKNINPDNNGIELIRLNKN